MIENLTVAGVGGFADHDYWSSSEFNAYNAWGKDFIHGNINSYKYYPGWIRAVRAF
jgi:hypothetical protein